MLAALTLDKSSRFFADRIGQKQSVTPEGFLLIEGVPIARTGVQVYGPDETPIKAGRDGIVRIDREDDQVFRPETIASFEGKDVIDDHIEEVTPENWRGVSCGHVQNVRRDGDFLVADLLIKHADTIAAIRDGKREVSCGYAAEYEETGPGRGRQFNIIGNHVALVKNGRCGPSCAIGDKEFQMSKTATVRDKLMKLFGVKDEAGLAAAMEKPADELPTETGGAGPVTINMNLKGAEGEPGSSQGADEEAPPWFKKHAEGMDARFKDIEGKMGPVLERFAKQQADEAAAAEAAKAAGAKAEDEEPDEKIKDQLKEEAPAGTADKAVIAKDSSFLADAFQETAALAEIIVPGIKIPVFDAKAAPTKMLDTICSLRRSTLDAAYMREDARHFVADALHGRTLDTKAMSCDALRHVFRSVGAMKRRANNAATAAAAAASNGTKKIPGVIKTTADLQALHKQHYG